MAPQYRDLRKVCADPGEYPQEDPASPPKIYGKPQKNGGSYDKSKSATDNCCSS